MDNCICKFYSRRDLETPSLVAVADSRFDVAIGDICDPAKLKMTLRHHANIGCKNLIFTRSVP